MAIIGVHGLLYSTEPEALRAMLRDVFGWKHVDAGEGWLIFALPPAELGVHPAEGPTFASGVRHQLSFMCDDIRSTIRELRSKGIVVKGEPQDEGWGITVMLALPGEVEVMLYEPRHATANPATVGGRSTATRPRRRQPGATAKKGPRKMRNRGGRMKPPPRGRKRRL